MKRLISLACLLALLLSVILCAPASAGIKGLSSPKGPTKETPYQQWGTPEHKTFSVTKPERISYPYSLTDYSQDILRVHQDRIGRPYAGSKPARPYADYIFADDFQAIRWNMSLSEVEKAAGIRLQLDTTASSDEYKVYSFATYLGGYDGLGSMFFKDNGLKIILFMQPRNMISTDLKTVYDYYTREFTKLMGSPESKSEDWNAGTGDCLFKKNRTATRVFFDPDIFAIQSFPLGGL